MAKEKLSEEKSAAIKEMIRQYDIKSAKDFEEAFKDMFGPILQSMLEGELDSHLGYQKYERNGPTPMWTRSISFSSLAISSASS